MRVARRVDYRRRVGLVRAPTLVLAGRFDPQMPLACAEELVGGIPDSRLVVFERSGHYPSIEEPDAFWPSVQNFLAERHGDAAEPLRALQLQPSPTC
jgi:proline iminopeptidase